MTELLHSWAIAPAALGACCLAADRGRVRWPDAVASVVMLLAMLDAALTRLVAPVYWAVLLLACAMAFAAVRRPRGRQTSTRREDAGMTVHTAIGMVAMAGLQLGMMHEPGPAVASAAAHAHGGAGSLLTVLLIGGALAYATLSAMMLARAHRTLDRAQAACMGVSVMIMAVAVAI